MDGSVFIGALILEMPSRQASFGGRPAILVLTDWYLPGFKAGGPIESLRRLTGILSEDYDFRFVTRDRDRGDPCPYAISPNQWHELDGHRIIYLRPGLFTLFSILRGSDYDCLYVNSFFSPLLAVLPLVLRRFRLLPGRPVVLAPRGEFSPGAMELKRFKKRVYLNVAKLLRLCDGITWHAESAAEERDIAQVLAAHGSRILVAAPAWDWSSSAPLAEKRRQKVRGKLRVVFLARIARNKNLAYAINVLAGLRGVSLEIVGPVDDEAYWEECRREADALASQVPVRYRGAVPHDQVGEVLRENDLLLFPTRGENYGHVIIESLRVGVPVLISNRTPWSGLEASHAGWSLPLEKPEAFRAILQWCVDAGPEEFHKLSAGARGFAEAWYQSNDAAQAARTLFQHALSSTRGDAP